MLRANRHGPAEQFGCLSWGTRGWGNRLDPHPVSQPTCKNELHSIPRPGWSMLVPNCRQTPCGLLSARPPVQDAIAAHRAQELLLKRGVECTAQETFLLLWF